MSETPKAGRELDALVAERVMGWTRHRAICYGEPVVKLVREPIDAWSTSRSQRDPGSWEESTDPLTTTDNIPRYSTDIAAAWLVLTSRPLGKWSPSLSMQDDGTWWCGLKLGYNTSYTRDAGQRAATPPLAICLAALRAAPPEEVDG